jgi:hypothetical protein
MNRRTTLLLLGLMPLLGACRGDAPALAAGAEEVAAAPAELVIVARDFQFADMPSSVAAGLTNIRLINEGPDFHHVWLLRLDDGHTLDDALDAFAAGGPLPEWMVDVGGPNTPGRPGEETSALVDLQPGTYAVVCVIPADDGVPHIMKGMVSQLEVLPSDAPPAQLPAADVVMTLDDYSFGTDRPITAGRQTIRVLNNASQPHEVLFVRLEPGRTPMDFVMFVDSREGDPPGRILGGTTGIAQGGMNQITLDFEPGDYALLCFIPDAGDGQPHFVHGMMERIRVE